MQESKTHDFQTSYPLPEVAKRRPKKRSVPSTPLAKFVLKLRMTRGAAIEDDPEDYTQTRFAEDVGGITQVEVGRLEAGTRKASPETLLKLRDFMRKHPTALDPMELVYAWLETVGLAALKEDIRRERI
jgi:hypothetical protein